MTLEDLATLLRSGGHSLAIYDGTAVHTYGSRGVADLYRLLREAPATLPGAMVADKVVGKGAAALMILGGVREVFTYVISSPALKMLEDNGIPVRYVSEVPHIINRSGTGLCPVETLCGPCATAADCLPLIEGFMAGKA